jgi:periplasmic protein TonB
MTPGPRTASIAATVALHAVAFAALLQIDAVRKPLMDAVPIMVSLLTPPKLEAPPPPKVVPTKPRPVAREPVKELPPPEPPPLVAVEPSASSPVVTAPPPPPPKVEPAPVVAPPAPSAPAPVVPPRFDAAYLRNPAPLYPPLSKRRGEQGTVLLRVFVNAEGAAEQVQIRKSSGHELLDQAAHDTVHRWRFVPARQGDQPVAAWVLVPIVFRLEG